MIDYVNVQAACVEYVVFKLDLMLLFPCHRRNRYIQYVENIVLMTYVMVIVEVSFEPASVWAPVSIFSFM
jgi:hypothetical protein